MKASSLLILLLATACDSEPEPCNEAGICGDLGTDGYFEPEPYPEPDVDPDASRYVTLRIVDLDSPDDMTGTTGVDLCGVSVDCERSAIRATAEIGEGEVCMAEGPGCSTNRADPQAILDDGAECEAAPAPSHYISLGSGGQIDVLFDGDLSGCEITIVEYVGATEEGWAAFVCDATGENCIGDGEALHTAAAGGTESFTVPAAE